MSYYIIGKGEYPAGLVYGFVALVDGFLAWFTGSPGLGTQFWAVGTQVFRPGTQALGKPVTQDFGLVHRF